MTEITEAAAIIESLESEANKVLASVLGCTMLEAINITQGNFPNVWNNPRDLKLSNGVSCRRN